MTGRNIRQAQILIEVVVMSKITEKIAKLLALAESPYEEEAKAALLQALSEPCTRQQGFGDRVYRHGGRLQALQAGVSLCL